jgi:hypothetical protein
VPAQITVLNQEVEPFQLLISQTPLNTAKSTQSKDAPKSSPQKVYLHLKSETPSDNYLSTPYSLFIINVERGTMSHVCLRHPLEWV